MRISGLRPGLSWGLTTRSCRNAPAFKIRAGCSVSWRSTWSCAGTANATADGIGAADRRHGRCLGLVPRPLIFLVDAIELLVDEEHERLRLRCELPQRITVALEAIRRILLSGAIGAEDAVLAEGKAVDLAKERDNAQKGVWSVFRPPPNTPKRFSTAFSHRRSLAIANCNRTKMVRSNETGLFPPIQTITQRQSL
jgi:hypothetical protein